jgi:hypothetical protein
MPMQRRPRDERPMPLVARAYPGAQAGLSWRGA